MTTRPRYAGAAAFAREDVEDAHRREPDFELAQYAAARGLETLGSRSAAGHLAAMPGKDDLQFNVLRGALAGGEHGILFHELLAWQAIADRPAGAGSFYGVRYNSGKLFRKPDRYTVLRAIPIVGDVIERPADADSPEQAFGIPVTTAATLVPEATAAGDWSIDNQPTPPVAPDRTKLDGQGLGGWALVAKDELHAGFAERLLAGSSLRSTLAREAGRPFFQVRMRRGTLTVRSNGWLRDADALDELAGALSALTADVRAAGLAVAEPRPFSDPLPAADWPPSGVSLSARFPPDPWLAPLHAFAGEHGLVIEDRRHYHSAFPTLPVPGRVIAVMRGRLPGTNRVGRLAWHAERPEATRNVGRNAVLLPARHDADATAPAGIVEGNLRLFVRGGVFAAWARRDSVEVGSPLGDLGPMLELIPAAVAAGQAHGLI